MQPVARNLLWKSEIHLKRFARDRSISWGSQKGYRQNQTRHEHLWFLRLTVRAHRRWDLLVSGRKDEKQIKEIIKCWKF